MKKALALVFSAIMALSLAACGGASSSTAAASSNADGGTKTEAKSYDKLIVGTMPLTVGVQVQYAMDKDYFEDAGLNVEIEYFATGAPINEAIAANEIDIACSGFASVYSLANAGCVWLADVNTTGGMGVYARADSALAAAGNTLTDNKNIIGSADTLKGLQVLEPLGTAVQYMAECYADKFGLTPNDINQVNMEFASAYQAFQTGEGDLAAMNPPYSYQMDEEG